MASDDNSGKYGQRPLQRSAGVFALLINGNIYYTFIWLFPLGILELRYVPRGWIWGTAATVFVVLNLSAAIGVGDNTGRPLFSAMGPMPAVAVSLFLWNFPSVNFQLSARVVGKEFS